MTTKKTPKTPKLFTCEVCDFVCRNKKDYNKHLTTRKHEILTKGLTKKMPENICKCGKKYKHRQSLYNHQRTCPLADNEEEPITQPIQAVEQPDGSTLYYGADGSLINPASLEGVNLGDPIREIIGEENVLLGTQTLDPSGAVTSTTYTDIYDPEEDEKYFLDLLPT